MARDCFAAAAARNDGKKVSKKKTSDVRNDDESARSG
jgi:hypothetical protein